MSDFVVALRNASSDEFEKVLYEGIRLAAAANCAPGTRGLSDNPDSQRYDLLQNSLFDAFERYITNDDNIGADGTTDRLDRLESDLKRLNPRENTICAYRFRKYDPVFSCRECAVDPTCVLCLPCFMKSVHQNHNYEMHNSNGGGYCDCGDPEAWRSSPNCGLHGGSCNAKKLNSSDLAGSDPITTDDDAHAELETEKRSLKEHIDSLPIDLVCRIDRLLRPLINSSIACLIDLVQRKPCFTMEPLSHSSPNEPYIAPFVFASETETEPIERASEKTRTLSSDELWLNSDNVINAKMEDVERLLDVWPPPVSHIPLLTQSMDSTILGSEVSPRTAPVHRKAPDIEMAASTQLYRARRLHPRLFPPWPMRTASERTASQQSFVLVLYNNEYHNHDQVVKTLRRVLGVTSQQGVQHAALVDQFGRSVLQTQLTMDRASKFAASIMRTSDHISRRPINCTLEHVDIYTMTTFFTLFLRWLTRLSDRVPSIHPVICHALLGFFPSPDSQQMDESGVEVRASLYLPVLYPGEMMKSDSWLSCVLNRHSSTWRAVRQEIMNVIMAVLLREPFYRRVTAIAFTRSYKNILQAYVYDDHHLADSLLQVTVQFYTVTSLARQMLEDNNILVRLMSHLAKAVEVNSTTLPPYYTKPPPLESGEQTAADGNGSSSSSTSSSHERKNDTSDTSISEEDLLKQLNPSEWDHTPSVLPQSSPPEREQSSSEPRILDWSLRDSNFDTGSRLFHSTSDLMHVLNSLTNLRPLSSDPTGLGGWWTDLARMAFADYVQLLLRILTHVQDLDGMQRETRFHVEHSAQHLSGLYVLECFNPIIRVTVQLASSDKVLFQNVLAIANQIFDCRVGCLDRRFRVPPLYELKSDDRQQLAFQSLGVTTETFAYDVATYRISVVQPLHRFLVKLYADGLQMGLTLLDLGLTDKSFANLLLERPLQVLTFYAQYHAKMWVRNGFAASQTVLRLHFTLRNDLNCDLQLIQLIAASGLIPADEFIVRLIHKLQLSDCFKSPSMGAVTVQGRMPTLEALLWMLLSILTSRSAPGIGDYTDDYIRIEEEEERERNCETVLHPLRNCLMDERIESKHALQIEKTIHALCEGASSYSLLRQQFIKNQSLDCLLNSADNADSELIPQYSSSNPEPLLLSILERFATQSSIRGKTVFSLKSEVVAYRIDRFHWHLSPERQIKVEKSVQQSLKKYFQTESENGINTRKLPIPPPPPLPLHRFRPDLAAGLLGIVRCTTFVRLLRTLLDMAINSRARTLCSDTALDLTLHLLTVALYEDEIEGRLTGSFPFLDAVVRVPIQTETDEELERLALSKHWLISSTHLSITEESLADSLNCNCLVDRLTQLLTHPRYEDQTDLIAWTLNRWKRVASRYKEKLGISSDDVLQPERFAEGSSEATAGERPAASAEHRSISNVAVKKRQTRADQMEARRARIMARMSEMQRSCMNAHAYAVDQEEPMDVDRVTSTISPVGDQIALGPRRSLVAVESILSSGTSQKTLICSVCLEEVAETESSRMVISAHVCPSSVLSSYATEWLSGPKTVEFVSRLLHASKHESTLRPISQTGVGRVTMDVDPLTQHHKVTPATESDDLHAHWIVRNERLDSFMSSLATTSAAKKAGFAKGMLDSSACDDIYPQFFKSITTAFTEATSDAPKSFATMTKRGRSADGWDFTLTGDDSTGSEDDDHSFDRWSPRPLVTSRDPICEEGSFVSFCFHPLHASCKAKHAVQLKARFNRLAPRQMTGSETFKFSCPICKTISNLDIPVLSSIPSTLPSIWLQTRLLMRSGQTPGPSDSTSAVFLGLSGWLDDLRLWLGLIPEFFGQSGSTTSDERASLDSDRISSVSLANFRSCVLTLESNPAFVSPELLLLFKQLADRIAVSLHLVQEESINTRIQSNRSAIDQPSIVSAMNCMFSCINRINNSQPGPSVDPADNFDSRLGSSRFKESTSWLLPPPPEPPSVTLNLFTLVQRLTALSRPKSERYRHSVVAGNINQFLDMIAFPGNPWFGVTANEGFLPEPIYIPPEEFVAAFETENDEVLISPATPPPNLSSSSSDYGATHHSSSSITEPTMSSNFIRLPPSESVPLHIAVESFSYSLRIFHDHLRTTHNKLASDNNYSNVLQTDDEGNIRFVSLISRLNQWARVLLSSAAQEWRTLRHTVAYTLVVSERTMRRDNPSSHFFNGGLSELCIQGLKHFITSSLTAHAKYAAVSRGCVRTCPRGPRGSQQHRKDAAAHSHCWPQRREHLNDWWWWNYCSPSETHVTVKGPVSASPNASCHLNRSFSSIRRVVETATRVAVTQDARDLWRLLLPSMPIDFCKPASTDTSYFCSPSTGSSNLLKPWFCTRQSPSSNKTEFWSGETVSLIWEVDITFLFISLLHLRPGLEETGVVDCSCTRGGMSATVGDSANSDESTMNDETNRMEPGSAVLDRILLACDEGRPRQPVGDAHESHLVRLCYTALLVQSLLSWDPACQTSVSPELGCLFQAEESETIARQHGWSSVQLLQVWRRLCSLSNVPVPPNSSEFGDPDKLAENLGIHLRISSLPFLRIAAFVINLITDIPISSKLLPESSTMSANEHALLLAYLGLPAGPSDLLVILSLDSPIDEHDKKYESVDVDSVDTTLEEEEEDSHHRLSSLSESLWMARLITSWCLMGVDAPSRILYHNIHISKPYSILNPSPGLDGSLVLDAQPPTLPLLLPRPNIRLPSLVPLPREFRTMLSLVTEFNSDRDAHMYSHPYICLTCGYVGVSGSHLFSPRFHSDIYDHSRRMHSGYNMTLDIHQSNISFLSGHARHFNSWPSPYRDVFGEKYHAFPHNGNPLYLAADEYNQMNQLWLNHQLASNATMAPYSALQGGFE